MTFGMLADRGHKAHTIEVTGWRALTPVRGRNISVC